MSDLLRRNDTLRYTPAEKAISAAIAAVESMPADSRLTAATMLLSQAKDKVADFVDNVTQSQSVRSCEDNEFSHRTGEPFLRCDYCGSLDVDTMIALLKTPGTHFSGSDWKYGWPHKFYIDSAGHHLKFYARHLKDATATQLAEYNRLSRKIFGIGWKMTDKGLLYQVPKSSSAYGWQLDGQIGENEAPVFSEFCRVNSSELAKFFEQVDRKALEQGPVKDSEPSEKEGSDA